MSDNTYYFCNDSENRWIKTIIDKNRVDGFRSRITDAMPRNIDILARSYFGPDSVYAAALVSVEGRVITMRSWHPRFEKNPGLIVTSSGVETRKQESHVNTTTDAVDYRAFRKPWKAIEDAFLELKSAPFAKDDIGKTISD